MKCSNPMKLYYSYIIMGLLSMLSSCFTGKNKAITSSETSSKKSLYSIQLNSLDGKAINLADFKGKKILFVNTASECGFTYQYEDLEKLSKKYANDLVIIGSPCNQFGGQEPGSAEQIGSFCQKNYGVTFLLTEKLNVKGDSIHPLYAWLTQKNLNGASDFTVKWNFNKFLINENGSLTHYFGSSTKPLDTEITSAIENK
jgi:glutathione peroxidase